MHLYKPLIDVYIGNPHNNIIHTEPIECLVDSGADFNLFPSGFASYVGIHNIVNGEELAFGGIGNDRYIGYRHTLSLFLPQRHDVDVYFSTLQRVPILGRIGFFDQFKRVVFDEYRKRLLLNM